MCMYRIFLRINWWKNFEYQSLFAKVIIKYQGAYVFETQCICHRTIITDLYSAVRFSGIEALDAAQEVKWAWTDGFSNSVWKWECFRTVECQQVEFQVDGDWSSNRKSATGQFGVYARNDEHRSIRRTQSPRWCMGLYQLTEIRWSGCGLHLASLYSQFIGDPLPHWKPVLRLKQRLGVSATPALQTTLAWLFWVCCSLSKVTASVPLNSALQ